MHQWIIKTLEWGKKREKGPQTPLDCHFSFFLFLFPLSTVRIIFIPDADIGRELGTHWRVQWEMTRAQKCVGERKWMKRTWRCLATSIFYVSGSLKVGKPTPLHVGAYYARPSYGGISICFCSGCLILSFSHRLTPSLSFSILLWWILAT